NIICLLLLLFPPSFADGLTLLAPSSVFEGDNIVLTCWEENNRKKQISFYKDGKKFSSSDELSSFPIQSALLSDSGIYFCTAASKILLRRETSSEKVKITVQELFLRPVLTASSYQPTEGSPVTLTCQTQLPPERSHVQLQFCFFRDSQVLGSGWSSSPELWIPALGTEDSGSYWCQAETVSHRIRKQSLRSQIHVRIPVSKVSLEAQAPGGQVMEGGKLVLLCSVAEGTGNITFSWHREATGTRLGKKTQGSLSAELEIPAVKESDGGKYLCRADNGHDTVQSQVLNILVRIPVSRPVLTLGAPRAQAEVGDVVELHCEFYLEDVTLGNSSAPSGGGSSFNLSLTAEHSGNYSCEADNGLGAQRSEALLLLISGGLVSLPLYWGMTKSLCKSLHIEKWKLRDTLSQIVSKEGLGCGSVTVSGFNPQYHKEKKKKKLIPKYTVKSDHFSHSLSWVSQFLFSKSSTISNILCISNTSCNIRSAMYNSIFMNIIWGCCIFNTHRMTMTLHLFVYLLIFEMGSC
uniref:Fc receptor like 2 n=1 Tax=Spermophilus dauricus TaxID=99837 RepID=A0A8C9P266_SPEDA